MSVSEISPSEDVELAKTLREMASAQTGLNKVTGSLLAEMKGLRKSLDAIRLEVVSEKLDDVFDSIYPRLLSMPDTLRQLAESEASLSRFGDGEFRMLLRPDVDLQFQKNSPELRDELRTIISTDSDEQLLVAFPPPYRGPHWSGVWADNWAGLKKLIPEKGLLANSHISRPVFFEHFGRAGVEMWRDVWRGKSITVISGKGSRFELHPELFDNVKAADRIEAPAKNAYVKIESIMAHVEKDITTDLFLVALGPAGSVLSARLAASGRRALDVGHVSSSFLNVFKGGARPEQQPFVRVDTATTI